MRLVCFVDSYTPKWYVDISVSRRREICRDACVGRGHVSLDKRSDRTLNDEFLNKTAVGSKFKSFLCALSFHKWEGSYQSPSIDMREVGPSIAKVLKVYANVYVFPGFSARKNLERFSNLVLCVLLPFLPIFIFFSFVGIRPFPCYVRWKRNLTIRMKNKRVLYRFPCLSCVILSVV